MLSTSCALISEPKNLNQGSITDSDGCIFPGGIGYFWVGFGEVSRSSGPIERKLSIYAPDFFLRDPEPWFVFESFEKFDAPSLAERIPANQQAVALDWKASLFGNFQSDFQEIKGQIERRSLVKAVPFVERTSSRFDAAHRGFALANALKAGNSRTLLPYGLWTDNSGVLGTTPESLFELESDSLGLIHLKTMALAGTRTLDAPSLLDDPKQLREHQIVIEGLVEQLSPFGDVRVGKTVERVLPNLAHLFAPLSVIPRREVAFQEWVSALHPTAAIGAWPKEPGWQWLQNQPHASSRGRYGAPFGFISPDGKVQKCLVAIRNVQWTGTEAKVLAGSGIVAASKLETEWSELNAKLDSIQGALGL